MRGEIAFMIAVAACDRPSPLLICHNANCAGPVDSERDATLSALDSSLALREDGRPPFDGIELDLFWHGSAGDCRFGHAFADAAPVAFAASDRVASHLASSTDASWHGEPFQLFLDLKEFREHSPDPSQRTGHAGCALDVALAVGAAARTGGHTLQVVFSSKSPALLAAVRAEPRFVAAQDLALRLAGDLGIPRPLGAETRPLQDYGHALGLEVMAYNADFMTQGQYQALRALDLALAQWMNTTTIESLDAIERYRPTYVLASELPLVRSWLER
ncbi:MAG: hypothetical protein WKG01_35540 [Kofleriaceae bacterium]